MTEIERLKAERDAAFAAYRDAALGDALNATLVAARDAAHAAHAAYAAALAAQEKEHDR